MEIKTFFQENLQILSKIFVNTSFCYVHDILYQQHIVQVDEEIYDSKVFAKAQIEFELEFIKNFPHESLMFLTQRHKLEFPPFELIIKTESEMNNILTKTEQQQSEERDTTITCKKCAAVVDYDHLLNTHGPEGLYIIAQKLIDLANKDVSEALNP